MVSSPTEPRLESVKQLRVDGDRLNASIHTLAQIGALPNGGVKRIAYSDDDLQARQQIQTWMLELGMTVRIDAAGNVIGRYPGQSATAPALATGSHIDTVPNAGAYDGAYGVLAGLEVVRVLRDQQIHLHHPLEVIVFTDEEGSMIGSKAMSGSALTDPSRYSVPDGMAIAPALARVGGDWDALPTAQRTAADIAAFVELHVEQGPVLEAAGKDLGVVTGIVGQRRYQISVVGSSSHGGTTPMAMRRDALVAAAQIVLAVNRLALTPGDQVATVGQMTLFPNAANVIPGRVDLSLDIRDLSDAHLDDLMQQLQQEMAAIAATTQTQIQLHPRLQNQPAPAKPEIQAAIAQLCDQWGVDYLHLPSRASHDAQELAKFTDMAMIFVPSQGGISHAETEYTTPDHCTLGANLLLHTLLRLDQEYAQRHQSTC